MVLRRHAGTRPQFEYDQLRCRTGSCLLVRAWRLAWSQTARFSARTSKAGGFTVDRYCCAGTGVSCAHASPARNVNEQIKIKGGNNGNTNWIGGVGGNSEAGQRNHETRERRVRRSLLILIALRGREGDESGRAHRRSGGRLLLHGAFV